MAVSIRFDVTRRAQATNRQPPAGAPPIFRISRQCIVSGLAITGTETSADVLPKCLNLKGSPRFPQLGDLYPSSIAPASLATVVEQNVRGIDISRDAVDCDVVYESVAPPDTGSGGGIFFQITDGGQASSVDMHVTGNRAENISVFFDPALAATATSADANKYHPTRVRKINVPTVVRARGAATKVQWDSAKVAVRSCKGAINAAPWGRFTRGKMLCLGPTVTNLDSAGNTLLIELDFIEGDPDWYPIAAYRLPNGDFPREMVPEAILRAAGPPAFGAQIQRNGITMVSVYPEVNFNTAFGFAPT